MPGIVVGVDGSDGSAKALRWGLDEAEHHEWPVTVVMVRPAAASIWTAQTYMPYGPGEMEETKKAATALVEQVSSERGAPTTVPIHVVADQGQVAQVLMHHAEKADLLVVGSRGLGGFARLLLGSVSSAVVQHANCPVAVVPAAEPRE